MIIAIDFDGTITETNEYPQIGKLRKSAKKFIKHAHKQGHTLILYTCRENYDLEKAKNFLEKNDLLKCFSCFNENDKERSQIYGNDCRKIGCDWLIDDKAFAPWLTNNEISERIDVIFKCAVSYMKLGNIKKIIHIKL